MELAANTDLAPVSHSRSFIRQSNERRLAYPQEWNGLVECRQKDPDVVVYRKKCHNLDARVNCPDAVDPDESAELRLMVEELRATRNDSPSP